MQIQQPINVYATNLLTHYSVITFRIVFVIEFIYSVHFVLEWN